MMSGKERREEILQRITNSKTPVLKSMETLILGWSLKLAPLIRLDAYKRRRLETKLTAAGLDMTPEVYTAYTVLKPCQGFWLLL